MKKLDLGLSKLSPKKKQKVTVETKEYSVNKIATGLREMVKSSYLNGISGFARDIDSLYDQSVMDTLIRDFPNFESVLLLTSDVIFIC